MTENVNCAIVMILINELHFVTMCPLYEDILSDLFSYCTDNHESFNDLSNEDKFHFIMTKGDTATVKSFFYCTQEDSCMCDAHPCTVIIFFIRNTICSCY